MAMSLDDAFREGYLSGREVERGDVLGYLMRADGGSWLSAGPSRSGAGHVSAIRKGEHVHIPDMRGAEALRRFLASEALRDAAEQEALERKKTRAAKTRRALRRAGRFVEWATALGTGIAESRRRR